MVPLIPSMGRVSCKDTALIVNLGDNITNQVRLECLFHVSRQIYAR